MNNLSKRIKIPSGWPFALFCMVAAFTTYCSMYAFRKPFTAGIYADLQIWGVDYKIILITTQVLGYMLSKFIGIKVVSEMKPARRIGSILVLIGLAWLSLFAFALTPYPYNFVWLFFNGLPLGMIWGIVFSFLEGRRNTELLGAGMSVSFIVASGLVKAVGKYLVENHGVSEFWMPFLTGLLFIPTLLLGVWMLSKIPPPTHEDEQLRTKRVPMQRSDRKLFFLSFAPGIVLVMLVYVALTIFRDLRDNFAVELWADLGFAGQPEVLLTAEIPIAIFVFVLIGLMMFIRNNRVAFYSNLGIIIIGGVLLVLTTSLFQLQLLPPAAWMILVGFGMYLSYVSYHTMLFERWIALFKHESNIGFLMYIADSFGYLGSVGILFYKNFGAQKTDWLSFITNTSYIVGFATIGLGLLSILYFRSKDKQQQVGFGREVVRSLPIQNN
jgi:MFS family permease